MKKFFCFFSFSSYCLFSFAQLSVTELPHENKKIETVTDLFNFYIDNLSNNTNINSSYNIIISVFTSNNELVSSSVLKNIMITNNFNPLIYIKSTGNTISSTYGNCKESKFLKSNGRFLYEGLLHAYIRIEDSNNGIIFYQTNFVFGDIPITSDSTSVKKTKNSSILLRSDFYTNGQLENKFFFVQTMEAETAINDIPFKIGIQYSTFTDPALHNFFISYDYGSYLQKLREKQNTLMLDSLKALDVEKIKYNNEIHTIDSLNRIKNQLNQKIDLLSSTADETYAREIDSLKQEAALIEGTLSERLETLTTINNRVDSIRKGNIIINNDIDFDNFNTSSIREDLYFGKPHLSAFKIGRFSDCISEYTFWGGNITGIKTGFKIRNNEITVLAGKYKGFTHPETDRNSSMYYLKTSQKFIKSGQVIFHFSGFHHNNTSVENVFSNNTDNIISGIETNYLFRDRIKFEAGFFRSYVKQNAIKHASVIPEFFSAPDENTQNFGTVIYCKTATEIMRNNFIEYKVDYISDNYYSSGNPYLQNFQSKHTISTYHGLLDNRIKLVFSGNKIQKYSTIDYYQASASLKVNFRGYPSLLITYSPSYQNISDSIFQNIALFVVQSNYHKTIKNTKHIVLAQYTNQTIENNREGITASQNLSHSIINYDILLNQKIGFKCRIEYTKRAISDFNVFSQTAGISLKIKSLSNTVLASHYSVLGYNKFNISYRINYFYKNINLSLEYAILFSDTIHKDVFLTPNRLSASLTIRF